MYGCKKRISKLVNNALSQNFIVLLRIINSSLTNIRLGLTRVRYNPFKFEPKPFYKFN